MAILATPLLAVLRPYLPLRLAQPIIRLTGPSPMIFSEFPTRLSMSRRWTSSNATACAVVQLQKAMLSLTPEYRWIRTSMRNAEFADVYLCVYEDQRWFGQNYGDQESWRTGNP
jgi:hypothetical protein